MRLFVNSLEGKIATDFFELPQFFFFTWAELSYGSILHMENPKVQQYYNNLTTILQQW
jgi:hypothetical protein